MTNLLSKITTWFQPQPVKKKRTTLKINRIQPLEKLIVDLSTRKSPANIPSIPANQSFNSKPYRQLIGKLAKIAIARSRRRKYDR